MSQRLNLPGLKHARRKRGDPVTLTPAEDPLRVDTSVTPVTIPRLPDSEVVRRLRARREAERAERRRREREGERA